MLPFQSQVSLQRSTGSEKQNWYRSTHNWPQVSESASRVDNVLESTHLYNDHVIERTITLMW